MFSHEKGAVVAQGTGKVEEEDDGAQNLLKVGTKWFKLFPINKYLNIKINDI